MILQLSLGKDPPTRLAEYRRELAGSLAEQGHVAAACTELQILLAGDLEAHLELSVLCELADLQVIIFFLAMSQ